MSKLFIGFLSAAQLTALHAAGHVVATAVISADQHVIAIIKADPIGALIANDIATVKDEKLTGLEKAEKVIASAIPLIETLAAGGIVTLVASAENTAREVVQSLFNDTIGAVTAVLELTHADATSQAPTGTQLITAPQ